MSDNQVPSWKFLTNHAQVLVSIANDPGIRLREIGERVGITERAAHRIVVELGTAGYITRQRVGRRNLYTVNTDIPVHDPIAREQSVGRLLDILSTPPKPRLERRKTDVSTVSG
jgi:DNA-binding Lrp family transcriptional regulator